MTDQPAAPAEPRDARDILARLYREIGISAVAAALQVTAPKSGAARKAEKETSPISAHKKGLAA